MDIPEANAWRSILLDKSHSTVTSRGGAAFLLLPEATSVLLKEHGFAGDKHFDKYEMGTNNPLVNSSESSFDFAQSPLHTFSYIKKNVATLS